MRYCWFVFWCCLCLAATAVAGAAQASDLWKLVREGEEQALPEALAEPDNVGRINAPDAQGRTLLECALTETAHYVAPDVVNILLANRAGAGAAGGAAGLAALVVTQAPPEAAQAALATAKAQGVDVFAPFANGMSVWLWAAALGTNPEYITLLAQAGADVNQSIPAGEHAPGAIAVNALTLAATYNANPAVVRTLVDRGLDVNAPGQQGTPLLCASARNHNPAMIEALLEAGADPRTSGPVGDTALINAAAWADVPLLQKLLDKGADPQAVMDGGTTALFVAARSNIRLDVLRWLLDLGLDVNARLGEDDNEASVLMVAAEHNGNPAIIRALLERGADPKAQDGEGRTAWQRLSPERAAWLTQQGLDTPLRGK